MADNRSRRDVLKLMGLVGATWATTQLLAGQATSTSQAVSPIGRLLPDYFTSTRRNIVTRNAQRAMLSSQPLSQSHVHPRCLLRAAGAGRCSP